MTTSAALNVIKRTKKTNSQTTVDFKHINNLPASSYMSINMHLTCSCSHTWTQSHGGPPSQQTEIYMTHPEWRETSIVATCLDFSSSTVRNSTCHFGYFAVHLPPVSRCSDSSSLCAGVVSQQRGVWLILTWMCEVVRSPKLLQLVYSYSLFLSQYIIVFKKMRFGEPPAALLINVCLVSSQR